MVLRSKIRDMVIPDCTIHDLVLGDLQGQEDLVAMEDSATGETYTYGRMRTLSKAVASGLVRLGVKKGDVVLLMSPNNPQFAVILFAVMRIGAVVTTTNPEYTKYEIGSQLKDSGTSYIYTVKRLCDKAKEAAKRVESVRGIISLGGGEGCVPFSQLLSDDGSAFPHHVQHNVHEDTALILYSSGTTGQPKGVMLTHRNFVTDIILRQAPEVKRADGGAGQTTLLGYLPLYHTLGMYSYLFLGFYNRCKTVTMPRFHPERFLQLIEQHKVTLLGTVPSIAVLLAKSPLIARYDISSIKILTCGGAPLDSNTEDDLRKVIPNVNVRQGYGMTEALAVCGPLLAYRKPGSVGVLMANTEAKLVDVHTGKEVGQGERGEICVRGPQVMKGYLNKPHATRDTIDSDGFLHTGDVAYYDEDGDFYIVDRIKELIKVKGFQVAPAELESLLLGHPDVADVGVVGVQHPTSGQVPRAYVVRKDGSHVTDTHLHALVKEKLISYKWLTGGIEFVDAIPKSPTGKILRRKLADTFKSKL